MLTNIRRQQSTRRHKKQNQISNLIFIHQNPIMQPLVQLYDRTHYVQEPIYLTAKVIIDLMRKII